MKENKTIFQINASKECVPEMETHSFCDQETYLSLWKKTETEQKREENTIEELPKHVQVLVIGGGMAGVLTAYQLIQKGIDVIVLEKGKMGRNATANTTAKITSLHGGIYSKIVKEYGTEKAKKYYDIQQKSIQEYKSIIENCNISCDFEIKSHILYATNDNKEIEQEYDCIQKLKIPAKYITHTPLPFPIAGGIVFSDQAQFHPLKFLDQLAEGMPIYMNCQATRIDADGTVEVNFEKQLKADAIVIATHYPLINSKGFYFTRLDQERSYAMALQQNGGFDIHDMYIDLNEKGYSFRSYEDYLIMAVGNHRTGKKKVEDYYQQLMGEGLKWFPNARMVYQWSNQDCMSVDHIPYIGCYSKDLPNFFVASGFQQWGMTNSMAAATILTELITSGSSIYEDVFTPKRHEITGIGQYIVNGAISATGLMKQLMHKKEAELKDIKNGDAGIIRVEGQSVGIYKDDNGTIHAVDTKCPHLGCQLAWNANDSTWDCPCHGSRFDIDGHLIETPAQRNLDKVYKNTHID